MNYGFDGEKYRAASTHQKEWGAKLIAELNLAGTEHVLDLGSGDGALTAQIASLVPQGQAVGVDSSRSMIEVARRHEQPNLHFELLDINALSYVEQFDVVFSNATLHWVKDHRRLLGQVFAALKPGGMVRFNFAADGNCATFNRMVQELMASDKYARYFQGFEWPWYMPKLEEYQALASQFAFSHFWRIHNRLNATMLSCRGWVISKLRYNPQRR
jgi:trans-aconitate methyltransferase